jgi:hypothetical protein
MFGPPNAEIKLGFQALLIPFNGRYSGIARGRNNQ